MAVEHKPGQLMARLGVTGWAPRSALQTHMYAE